MAKIRFKSIFDRMLFLQCVTVLSLLLILGLGIGFVSRMQSLNMEKDILVEKGQQAIALLKDGGDATALTPLVEERGLLIQALYPEETISAYADEKWAPLVQLPAESTRAEEAVRRSALQCYVVEGVYPPDLAYLQDHYGLQVNTDNYYVVYEAFASNVPPTINVIEK